MTYTFKADFGMNMWTDGSRQQGFGVVSFTFVPGEIRKHKTKAEAVAFEDLNQGDEHYHTNGGHRTIVTLQKLKEMGWTPSAIKENIEHTESYGY